MRYLNQYLDYILLESVLLVSDDVGEILSNIKSKVGSQIWDFINTKSDIKTDYNTLGLSDKNDELFFLADTKTQKIVAGGESPFGSNKQAMKIGRIARAILQKNGVVASDKEIEEFVNEYKAEFDIHKGKVIPEENQKIKLVQGRDIRFWYHIDNYAHVDALPGSELGKSCMRHSRCADYFDIYVDNPEQCKLLIYLDDDDKLIGRALFWKIDTPSDCNYYLDRIYVINSSDKKVMVNWILDKFKTSIIAFYDTANVVNDNMYTGSASKSNIELKNGGDFDQYPYMDTFYFYTPSDSMLSSYDGELELTDVDGYNNHYDEDEDDYIYCEHEGQSFPSDEVVYSNFQGINMLQNNAIHSDRLGDWLWEDDSVTIDGEVYHEREVVFSKHLDRDLAKEDSILVYMNDAESPMSSDWFPMDDVDDKFYFDSYGNQNSKEENAYIADMFVLSRNSDPILKKWAIRTYDSLDNTKGEMYNDPCISKLDSKIFNIKIDRESKDWFDLRSYYQTKFLYASYNKWINIVNDLPITEDLLEKKLEQMKTVHEWLYNNDNGYRVDCDVELMGGKENILNKWRSMLYSKLTVVTKEEIEEAISDVIGYRSEERRV